MRLKVSTYLFSNFSTTYVRSRNFFSDQGKYIQAVPRCERKFVDALFVMVFDVKLGDLCHFGVFTVAAGGIFQKTPVAKKADFHSGNQVSPLSLRQSKLRPNWCIRVDSIVQ